MGENLTQVLQSSITYVDILYVDNTPYVNTFLALWKNNISDGSRISEIFRDNQNSTDSVVVILKHIGVSYVDWI